MRITAASMMSCLALALAPSCKSIKDNPNHCQNNDGNNWCADRFPDRPFCSIGACTPDVEDGCMAERPEDDACYSPCGDDQTFEDDPSCDGVADSGTDSVTMTSSMSDTAPTATTDDPTLTTSMSMSASESETESATETSETESTTGPTGCVSSIECTDPAAPICEDMVCAGCTSAADGDAACASKDPNAPACRDDGECVQCTPANASACADVTPVCDDGSSSCVGCTYHEQCPESACQIDTGECFDESCVVTVDGDGPADHGNIADGIMNGCVVIVHELDGATSYQEALTINGMSVALLAADGELPRVQGTGGAPSLTVSGGAQAYVQGLMFSLNGSAEGVAIDGANVWLDRSRVVQNTGGGITLTNDAYTQVRNCFVGGSVNNVPVIDVTGSSIDVIYSTLGAGFGATAVALRCSGVGGVNVSDSLLVTEGDADAVDCTTDTFITSLTEDELGPMNPSWFGGYASGDLSLNLANAPKEILTAAEWNTGEAPLPNDPATDIDGDLRPTEDGASDVAGADIP